VDDVDATLDNVAVAERTLTRATDSRNRAEDSRERAQDRTLRAKGDLNNEIERWDRLKREAQKNTLELGVIFPASQEDRETYDRYTGDFRIHTVIRAGQAFSLFQALRKLAENMGTLAKQHLLTSKVTMKGTTVLYNRDFKKRGKLLAFCRIGRNTGACYAEYMEGLSPTLRTYSLEKYAQLTEEANRPGSGQQVMDLTNEATLVWLQTHLEKVSALSVVPKDTTTMVIVRIACPGGSNWRK
jgi:hypothetical protein